MSNLVPGKRGNMTRTQRVDRASNLIMAAGGFGVIFVVTLILAVAGVIGGGPPLVAAIITAVLSFGAYRTINRR
jgi:hypothetical protein